MKGAAEMGSGTLALALLLIIYGVDVVYATNALIVRTIRLFIENGLSARSTAANKKLLSSVIFGC